jgi:predicted hydrocarbon binding protein
MLQVDDSQAGGEPVSAGEAVESLPDGVTDLSLAEERAHLVGPAGHTYVAHCNHYNCFLQKTLTSNKDLEMEEVLVDTASMLFFLTFARTFRANRQWSEMQRLAFIQTYFRQRGYGNPTVTDAATQKTITASASHHSSGYKAKFGEQESPQDFFLTGAIQGALMATYGCDVDVKQRQCLAMGDDRNTWAVRQRTNKTERIRRYLEDAQRLKEGRDSISPTKRPDELPAPPVTRAVRNMDLSGDDEEGLIPAFNVYLTFIPSLYYNICSTVMINRLGDNEMSRDLGRRLLKEAGHVCGFFTLGNIIKSSEYELLRKSHFGANPSETDSMTTLFGVVNAFGWGTWTLDYLAEKELRFTVHNSYEAYNYREYFGYADQPVCHLHTGGGEAIMNALRYGDIFNTGEPLDDAFVNRVFEQSDGFRAFENHCFAVDGPGNACTIQVAQ